MSQQEALSARDLLVMKGLQLAAVMAAGHPIDRNELDETEYRGVSLNTPYLDRILWKTFMKTFHRDPQNGILRGWNVRLKQTGVEGPIEPKMKRGVRATFGHYHVLKAKGRPMPRPWDQALFLDYGCAGNPPLDLARFTGTPLVAVNAGSTELLLGWECFRVGSIAIPTPNYWSLERIGPLSHRIPPPRRV